MLAAICFAQPPAGIPNAGDNGTEKIEILTSIGFSGNTKFNDDELMGVIGMKVGDNLKKEMIGAAIQNIVDMYRNNGAIFSAKF